MKVLIAHVPYQHRGGEDAHVEVLAEAYKAIDVEPILYPPRREPASGGFLSSGLRSIAKDAPPDDFLDLWDRTQPAFIHAHNLFPLLGPAFLEWVARRNARLVMTVHNHRFFCANGLALRNGRVCKDCFEKAVEWRPVLYNCNGSRAKSAYHAAALTRIRREDLYLKAAQAFIAPSPYIAGELIRYGAEPARVVQIMNPVPLKAEPEPKGDRPANRVFYAGRLAPEKGIADLLEAAFCLSGLRFTLAGDGPLRGEVEEAARSLGHLEFLGSRPREAVSRLIQESTLGVLPSICNEVLPTFVLECFASGVPCVIPDAESTRWLAAGDYSGLGVLFRPGDSEDLARAIREGLARGPADPAPLERVRHQLSFDRFTTELKQIVDRFRPLQ